MDKPPLVPCWQKTSLLPGDIAYVYLSEGTEFKTFRARVLQELTQRPFWTDHQHTIQTLSLTVGEASGVGSTDVEVVEPAPKQISDFWQHVTIRFTNERTVQVKI